MLFDLLKIYKNTIIQTNYDYDGVCVFSQENKLSQVKNASCKGRETCT